MKQDPIARLLMDQELASAMPRRPDFVAFLEVSRTFIEAYTSLVRAGLSPEAIAPAMMGATVNFYEMFDMSDELPELLRAIAERMERIPS